MSLKSKLTQEVQQRAQKTVMRLMSDERTRPVVARAMQAYMDGRQRVDHFRQQGAQSLGLATDEDVQRLRGRLRRIEKQLDRLSDRFQQLNG